MVIIKTQSRRPNNIQKTLPQRYKIQIKNLPFPGLALSGSEQPGPGATLLGWPKSIYYFRYNAQLLKQTLTCNVVTLVLRSSQQSEPTSAQCKACSDHDFLLCSE